VTVHNLNTQATSKHFKFHHSLCEQDLNKAFVQRGKIILLTKINTYGRVIHRHAVSSQPIMLACSPAGTFARLSASCGLSHSNAAYIPRHLTVHYGAEHYAPIFHNQQQPIRKESEPK